MVSILIFLPATFGIHEGPLGCKEHHAGKCRNPCQSSKKHEHYFQLSYQVCISFLSNPFSYKNNARQTSERQSAIFLFTIPAEVCSCPYGRPQLIPSFVAYGRSLGNLKRFQSKANERQNTKNRSSGHPMVSFSAEFVNIALLRFSRPSCFAVLLCFQVFAFNARLVTMRP